MMGRALPLLALVLLVAAGCDTGPDEPDSGPSDAGGCASDLACDDGVFCNGAEVCGAEGACGAGAARCGAGETCDEASRVCRSSDCATPDADGDGHDRLDCGGDDCDDADADRFPENQEICDAADKDEDCDPSTFGERDTDRDSYDDARCCNDEGDTPVCGEDCDDQRRSTNPDTLELCDGLDNDCDGAIDEEVATAGYWDEDLDGSGDLARPRTGCPGERRFALSAGDCNDAEPHQSHLLPEVCDERDNDCDGETDENPRPLPWYLDDDDDGYASPHDGDVTIACEPPSDMHVLLPLDCDDTTALRGPLVLEICDGIDNDCDGWPDFFLAPFDYEDDDRDTFGDLGCGGDDCDDADTSVFPGAPELDDGVDQDCDGRIDEDAGSRLFYADADGDGFGDPDVRMTAAAAPTGYVVRAGDCDDDDVLVSPDALETCDGEDEDCDTRVDEGAASTVLYADRDGDGAGLMAAAALFCVIDDVLPPGFVRADGDCDDDAAAVSPAALETCNDVNDDCDAATDEGVLLAYYVDGDSDGVAATTAAAAGMACAAPSGFSLERTDCDDANPAARPGATELCDLVDQDCDGAIDDALGCPRMIYRTQNLYNGNLGGIEGADAICNSDPGHPGGVYKALLWAPTRYPCTTPNCTGADVPLDWVILPDTTYRTRHSGNVMFTSNAEGIITSYPMSDSITPGATAINFWAGFASDWTLNALNCGGWTVTAGTAAVGWTPETSSGWLTGGALGCGVTLPLVCVQQ